MPSVPETNPSSSCVAKRIALSVFWAALNNSFSSGVIGVASMLLPPPPNKLPIPESTLGTRTLEVSQLSPPSSIIFSYGVGSVSGNADTKVTVNKVDGTTGAGLAAA